MWNLQSKRKSCSEWAKDDACTVCFTTNIKMLRLADFNKKLREHGVPKEVTVQKICKACRDEKQVREILDEIWKTPEQAKE